MHILKMVKGCEEFEGKVRKGVIVEYGVETQYLIFDFRWFLHKLIFVEQVNKIAKGIEASSSSYYDDFSWFCLGEF